MPDANVPRPNGNGFSLSYLGATFKASGRDVMLLLILLVGFSSIGWIMVRGFGGLEQDRRERLLEHRTIITAQNELACILAIPQDDRPPALSDPQGICHYVTTVYRFRGTRQ